MSRAGRTLKQGGPNSGGRAIIKNVETAKRFKRVVRILKNLENQMAASGACAQLASFLIESLVYNVPNECFAYPTWAQRVRSVLLQIEDQLRSPQSELSWREANAVNYLFHSGQRWTRDEAYLFARAAYHTFPSI